jgi:hypothetical protein
MDISEIASLGWDDCLEGMVAAREHACRAQALELRFLARMSALSERAEYLADEIAPELRISRGAAESRIALAEALLGRMPNLLAAMEAGQLDRDKARQAHEALAPLSDELARQADEILADRIGEKNPSNWRKALTRVVYALDPEGHAERAKARRADRKIELIHQPDAMATLLAYLPAEVASGLYARVDAIARTMKRHDSRTMDQIRADVFADLLSGDTSGQGVRAKVFLHVPLDTALGITDKACELVGHGTIPAALARDIMNNPNSVWHKVLVDPFTGAVKDIGRTRYRPSRSLDQLVRARDRTCRMPGCNRPAQRCDADHVNPWSKGGETCECNLCCLCRRHHRLKDAPGWRMESDPVTGEFRVTTPRGRTYVDRPEPIVEPRPVVTTEPEPPPF